MINLTQLTFSMVALASTAHTATQVTHQPAATANINDASLKAIESSWLQMPNTCKARGFNADAMPVTGEVTSPAVLSVFASFAASAV